MEHDLDFLKQSLKAHYFDLYRPTLYVAEGSSYDVSLSNRYNIEELNGRTDYCLTCMLSYVTGNLVYTHLSFLLSCQ